MHFLSFLASSMHVNQEISVREFFVKVRFLVQERAARKKGQNWLSEDFDLEALYVGKENIDRNSDVLVSELEGTVEQSRASALSE